MSKETSFSEKLSRLLAFIIQSNELHAKWLNTLSYLENCGARKIAACEDPTCVREEMLKHAAEEFRHAHYLKRQIEKIPSDLMPDYSPNYLLGGATTLNYLTKLDLQTCRYLKNQGLSRHVVKGMAYLLVTYAIELRAEQLYPIYEEILRKNCSKVMVKSILLEEKEHLAEMKQGIDQIPCGLFYAQEVCAFENALATKWLERIYQETTF